MSDEVTCPCKNCGPECVCAGQKPKNGECCYGTACTCGPNCKCPAACGCASAEKK